MAQFPTQEDSATAIPLPDPLQILTQELESQAAQFSQEAAIKAPEALQAADRINANSGLANVGATTDSIERAYESIVITNESLARKNRPIQTIPEGKRFIATGKDINAAVDATTGDIIVYESRRKHNSDSVARAVVETSGVEKAIKFDLNTELEKLKTLSGDNRLDYTSKLLVNIETEIAGEIKRVRQAAALESGYMSAQASLDRNIILDQTSGFSARYGQASGQTMMARQQMTTALVAAQHLEKSLVAEDSRISELTAAKNVLARIEAQRAQKEITIGERREAAKDSREERDRLKKENLMATVTPIELTNYKYVYGDSGDDEKDMMIIATRRDKDPVMKELLNANQSNINVLLMHPDGRIRDGALKLFAEYERANNPDIKDQGPGYESKLVRTVKKAIANPNTLIKSISNVDERTELENEIKRAKSGKEVAEIRGRKLPELLGNFVENEFQSEFLSNATTWKTPQILGDTPLAKMVKQVASTNPKGMAPLNSVVDSFFTAKIQTPDGKVLSFPDKIQMMEMAIREASDAVPRNLMLHNDTVTAMKLQALNAMKIRAATAFIRSQNYSINADLPGIDYLMRSKDFRKPVIE